VNSLRIEGGRPISGVVTVGGNKNAVLPMIAASLLTDEEVVLKGAPRILDVESMLEIAALLGVSVERDGGTIRLKASGDLKHAIPRPLCAKVRASILLTGPLLARTGKSEIWPPGGDVIGRRRLDAHFYGLSTLGASIDSERHPFDLTSGRLQGRDLFFDEASVTATENIMMAATLAEGKTIIRNAAAEPHVQALARLLQAMGAEIDGVGTNTIEIIGKEKLHGAEADVPGDHVEAASFLSMAAATGGNITVKGASPKDFWMTRRVFEKLGAPLEVDDEGIHLRSPREMVVKPDFGGATPIISDGPWPQYPSDMMSCTIVMASQAKGAVLFFEKMFEGRMYFVDRLIGMGANAIVCDPHRVLITGPSKLRGSEMSSPDIRAGMAMLIAALAAKGESVIHNADVIYRGYESVVEKITSLGADVEKL